MLNAFQPLRPFKYQWPAVFGNQGIRQPVFLLDDEGNALVDDEGNVLTAGFRRVKPQENEE
jgi:hypothetical protein